MLPHVRPSWLGPRPLGRSPWWTATTCSGSSGGSDWVLQEPTRGPVLGALPTMAARTWAVKVLCCPCTSGRGLALPEGKPALWLVVAPSFHFCSCHGLATASSRGLSLPSRQDGPSVSHMLPDSEMEWVPCLLLMASSAPARPGICWPLVTGLHRVDHVPNHGSHQEGCKVGLLLSPCSETMFWGLSLPPCSSETIWRTFTPTSTASPPPSISARGMN